MIKQYLILILILTFNLIALSAIGQKDSVNITKLIKHGANIENENPDSAIRCYKKAIQLCDLNGPPSEENISYLKAYSFQQLGWIIGYYKSNYNDAIDHSIKAILIFKKIVYSKNLTIQNESRKGIAVCLSDIGVNNYYKGDYSKAIQYYQQSIKHYEVLGKSKDLYYKTEEKKGLSKCYTNIGLAYSQLRNHDLTLEYYHKSEKIDIELKDTIGIRSDYINIGSYLYSITKYDESIIYYNKALDLLRKNKNNKEVSTCLNNLGALYKQKKDYSKAIEYYKEALKIDESIGDKEGIAVVNNNLATLNNNLKNYSQAISYSLKALKISEEHHLPLTSLYSYIYLTDSYDSLKNTEKAYYYFRLMTQIKDSLFNIEKNKQVTEMEAKYQTEKKQQEIEKQGILIQKQSAESAKQQILIYAFLGGFALMLFLALVIYKNYSQKKKANEIITIKNIALSQANEEITSQRDEIESQRDEITAQRDLVTKQKDYIEETHELLTSSIRYAERIQHAMLPSQEIEEMLLANHFILFKPRDIVSGDFYWTMIKRNYLYIAVADCTGHGVPGAFMSMLGISFLNEIVAQSEFNSTSSILNKLRDHIIKSLQQQGVSGEQKDGMDMSLISLNLENNLLHFSGANNPIYIVRKSKAKSEKSEKVNIQPLNLGLSDYQLYELKPDKMPIAIYEQMNKFTDKEFQLCQGDTVFLFSDGYPDQFGGPLGKKFMYKKFKEVLLNNCEKTMSEQKEILETELMNWKGNNEQTDDITVVGIKI